MKTYKPVEIEKVLVLKGARDPIFEHATPVVYAHVSSLTSPDGKETKYALLALFPQHGVIYLGKINPRTGIFDDNELPLTRAFYERAGNNVINSISLPDDQIGKLQTLDDILNIEGITVARELVPRE